MASKQHTPARRGERVPAHFVIQLMDAIGPTRAHKALGVSTTALYKARKRGEVSKVLEVAAQGALQASVGSIGAPAKRPTVQPFPKPGKETTHKAAAKPVETVLLLMEVPVDKAPALQRLAAQVGAVVTH